MQTVIQPVPQGTPPMPPWQPSEMVKQMLVILVRHGLTKLGGALIALDLVKPEVFGSWKEAHIMTVVALVISGIGLAWSAWQKQQGRLLQWAALWTSPQKKDGTLTTLADVARSARRVSTTPSQMLSMCLALVMMLNVPFLTGCWLTGGGTAEDQLANANYEISGFIGDAQTAILEALKARVVSPEAALAAGGVIETKLNLPQQKFLQELVNRLEDSSKSALTDADKTYLLGLVEVINDAATQVVNDPAIIKLDSGTRAGLTAALLALKPATLRLIGLIRKAPTEKAITPSLRDQLRGATKQAEAKRTRNDQLFADLQAEVSK